MEPPAHVNEQERYLQVRATDQLVPDLGYGSWVLNEKTSFLFLCSIISEREDKS
jgi:hypothetical protein